MAQFYADEDFPLPATEELRRLGHDVLTIQQDGRANQGTTDESVLRRATELGRAVLTHNRKHFWRLHEVFTLRNEAHAGIVVCVVFADAQQLAGQIAANTHGQVLANKAIRVPPRPA